MAFEEPYAESKYQSCQGFKKDIKNSFEIPELR